MFSGFCQTFFLHTSTASSTKPFFHSTESLILFASHGFQLSNLKADTAGMLGQMAAEYQATGQTKVESVASYPWVVKEKAFHQRKAWLQSPAVEQTKKRAVLPLKLPAFFHGGA